MRPLKIDDIIDQEVNKFNKFYSLILPFLLALIVQCTPRPMFVVPISKY